MDSSSKRIGYCYFNVPLFKTPKAFAIVKNDIKNASKNITFPEQYQKDDILPEYRKIIVRDYKILYKEDKEVIYILNIICTRSGSQ